MEHLQWLAVTRRGCRMLLMDNGRLAKQIFTAYLTCANSACKTWFFIVIEFYSEIGHDVICRDRDSSVRVVLTSVDSKLLQYYETQWQERLHSHNAIRGPQQVVTNLEYIGHLRNIIVLNPMLK